MAYQKIAGPTMGTSYHITAEFPADLDSTALKAAIDQRLVDINQSMSTYIADSEISQFNHLAVQQAMSVSTDFVKVLLISKQIYQESDGAFNPTIGPLVDLWGFGPALSVENFQKKPAVEHIQAKLSQLDFTALILDVNKIRKLKPLSLDFSAVAKGYAVDEIADLLIRFNVLNYMVEIGGEVMTAGLSPRGVSWRIGIEQPSNVRGKTFKALQLNNAAVATSGDYRNYMEIDGKRYSHTIDPVTGYPVDHKLSSVTVIAKTVAVADAWATAIMVLGQDKGYQLAKSLNLAIYMIYRDGDDFAVKYTAAMQPYLAE
ncbi:MAG: FAD:protein FMN transferase [Pseudomonadales bacterium]|nr:FAD:protein FMN transferase [Pseudomonadales bacterium]